MVEQIRHPSQVAAHTAPVVGMSADERARFLAVVDALDAAFAERPDLLASPVGFVAGALVGAGRSDPEDAWRQISGFADMLAYLSMYVRGNPDATVEGFVNALIPPA